MKYYLTDDDTLFANKSRQSQRAVPRASVLCRALAFSLEPSCNAAFLRTLSRFSPRLSGAAGGGIYGGTAESVRMSSLPLWQLEPKDYS